MSSAKAAKDAKDAKDAKGAKDKKDKKDKKEKEKEKEKEKKEEEAKPRGRYAKINTIMIWYETSLLIQSQSINPYSFSPSRTFLSKTSIEKLPTQQPTPAPTPVQQQQPPPTNNSGGEPSSPLRARNKTVGPQGGVGPAINMMSLKRAMNQRAAKTGPGGSEGGEEEASEE